MKQDKIPKYVAQYRTQDGWHDLDWEIHGMGKPTNENAERLRVSLNASFGINGVNKHCGEIWKQPSIGVTLQK